MNCEEYETNEEPEDALGARVDQVVNDKFVSSSASRHGYTATSCQLSREPNARNATAPQ
jgi:hypothetical protein